MVKRSSIRAILTIAAVLGYASFSQAQTYTISPPPFLLAQNNAGAIINNACVWTYTAGTTTAATTYSDNIGTQNLNPIRSDSAGRFTAYLVPGNSYKFVYESSCTPPSHGTVLRTADNINAIPAASGNVDTTGTAGEALTAGQVVYLSDGSGSKNAGQWYKADYANAYSSATPPIGMVPSSIASGSSGTIRLAGQITGLTVSTGSDYYVGAAGAITSTAPAQARKIGRADSATSVDLPLPAVSVQTWADDFRLGGTSGSCNTTSDVTAITTIFLTPCTGNRIDLPDSAGNPIRVTSAEFSIAVPATTATAYDLYVYNNAGVATLEALAWTSVTARATATVRTTTGRLTKSGDLTRLYVGSFLTTGVSGQTEDSAANRLLWNEYNRRAGPMGVFETTDTWSYNTNTWRQARATATNQLVIFQGQPEEAIDVTAVSEAQGAGSGQTNATGVGEDSTSAIATGSLVTSQTTQGASLTITSTGRLTKVPAVGKHTYVWLEICIVNAGGAMTWFGDNGDATRFQSGITAQWNR